MHPSGREAGRPPPDRRDAELLKPFRTTMAKISTFTLRRINAQSHGQQLRLRSRLISSKKDVVDNIPIHASLSCHWGTVPPTPFQLRKAAEFFQNSKAKFLWSAEKFREMPFGEDFGESPEVCFLGRSNVGKSSLLNTLLCQRIAFTSSKPGRTKLMSAFAVESKSENRLDQLQKNKLIVLDVPGYGKGGRADVGYQVIQYLEKRRQLKRVFLLVETEHGVKSNDKKMIELCRQIGVPFQVILSKVDKVISPTITPDTFKAGRLEKTIEEVKNALGVKRKSITAVGPAIGEIIPFSSTKWMNGKRIGINEVRFAILRATELEYREIRRKLNPVEIITYDQLFPSETEDTHEDL
ncbi:putative GTP-binding protein EngB [Golovinomyces cichoracearum]|uniref:GTP-binding protein 8 n=1 Tax=Golovinomyces cichoracearum TaxID=62708 RepID=A0A420J6V6_9PEZI|nr:putative GTP-binding protein EngB [Golovinomyces cichoracearum]